MKKSHKSRCPSLFVINLDAAGITNKKIAAKNPPNGAANRNQIIAMLLIRNLTPKKPYEITIHHVGIFLIFFVEKQLGYKREVFNLGGRRGGKIAWCH